MASTKTPDTSKFIPADDDDDEFDDASMPAFGGDAVLHETNGVDRNKGKGREVITPITQGPSASQISGNIGSGGASSTQSQRRMVGGVQVETRYTGVDTLDEPILTTISRDLMSIYSKLIQVLWPRRTGAGREVLRDWDLWGVLILCLALALLLSINAPPKQSLGVFTGVIVIVSLGSLVVTLNTKLLGGRVSVFQSLCVLGYCIFPLVLVALISTFVRVLWIRGPLSLGAWGWAVWAAMNFLDGTNVEEQRVLLAVYPLLLFYFILAWMILIQ